MQGETYPLIQTYQRFQTYQQLWGSLEWQGVFAPENLTAQAAGNDPTGDDPSQISKSAFIEGYPNTTALDGYTAAQFMIEQVHKHPGQVSIYSAVSPSPFTLPTSIQTAHLTNTQGLPNQHRPRHPPRQYLRLRRERTNNNGRLRRPQPLPAPIRPRPRHRLRPKLPHRPRSRPHCRHRPLPLHHHCRQCRKSAIPKPIPPFADHKIQQ